MITKIVNGETISITMCGKILANNRPLKQYDNGYGYKTVSIKSKLFYVHRLICSFYNGDTQGMDVNHKDGNRGNNKINNLEWCTRSENQKHAYRVLKRQRAKPQLGRSGEKHHRSLLIKQLTMNGELIKTWCGVREAARHFNCTHTSICSALRGRSNTSCGFKWEYI